MRSQATLQSGNISRTQLSLLRTEIQELIKYVALNYIAVVKAIKKRNRHLKVGTKGTVTGGSQRAICLFVRVAAKHPDPKGGMCENQ